MQSSFLTRLRVFSIVEGVSTLILFFVAMPLKYMADMPMAVTVAGSIHGGLFVGLFVFYVIAIQKLRIPLWLFAAGVLGAILPFGPFIVDIWLKKFKVQPATQVTTSSKE